MYGCHHEHTIRIQKLTILSKRFHASTKNTAPTISRLRKGAIALSTYRWSFNMNLQSLPARLICASSFPLCYFAFLEVLIARMQFVWVMRIVWDARMLTFSMNKSG